jgi:hypothetical protein
MDSATRPIEQGMHDDPYFRATDVGPAKVPVTDGVRRQGVYQRR